MSGRETAPRSQSAPMIPITHPVRKVREKNGAPGFRDVPVFQFLHLLTNSLVMLLTTRS
jgi:hypothetical protein